MMENEMRDEMRWGMEVRIVAVVLGILMVGACGGSNNSGDEGTDEAR
jgi:hypothetical protein